MSTNTATAKVWLITGSSLRPDEIHSDNAQNLMGRVSLLDPEMDMSSMGWTLIGTATITLDLVDRRTLIDNKVESLKAEAASIRAEAYRKAMHIDNQIQQLLAIDYTPEVVA